MNLLLVYLAYKYWRGTGDLPSEKMVICASPSCRYMEVRKLKKISDIRCSKCKKAVKLAYKCRTCKYEFAYLPSEIPDAESKTAEEIFNIRREEAKCPNCGSIETDPVLIR